MQVKYMRQPNLSAYTQAQTTLSGLESPFKHLPRKKRIGPYYYYLDECIGSGYSSQVFKARHTDRNDSLFAVKVVRLRGLDQGKMELLQNEIKILGKLQSPHLLALEQVVFTPNNCYIVTEYCEGGTLQNHIEVNPDLDWQEVCAQLLQGLKYLSQHLIVHRDIKPANIFLKGETWKIGDFGFARYLPTKVAQVQELYMVGSPLYMPPETLEKKIYSIKTDSFAFGILLFHLATGEFPWSGRSKQELLLNYATCPYPCHKIQHLSPKYQALLKGLCEIQINRRINIEEIEDGVGETETTGSPIRSQCDFIDQLHAKLQERGLTNGQKITLCKFIHYIDCNIQHFEDMCEFSEGLRRVLKTLGVVFGWHQEHSAFAKFIDEFKCRNYQQFEKEGDILAIKLVAHAKQSTMEGSQIQRCVVLKSKLRQLTEILKILLIDSDSAELIPLLNSLILHPDFARAHIG